MCGIAGWIGSSPEGDDHAECMAQALRHRGPDASGTRSWADATLVHTRLSILDLSPTGAQPMANEDGTIWTVFNGEIYNHREQRRNLEARGHRFRGRSDTEVIVHLYEDHGMDFVSELRGMFALAIYDTRARTLVLTRDRFGIKPLFYAPGDARLAFASEVRALRGLPGVDLRPDRQAIFDFAALSFIPAPSTFYTGIRALQPGELLVARMDGLSVSWRTKAYHTWTIRPDPEMTLEAAADRTEELLAAAVRRQMQSDVPLGALLSGGIDSSLVCAAAQQASDGGLRTYNVRFHEERYDETWAAKAVADSIGSLHETLNIGDVRGSWDYVISLLQHCGQPYADTSIFPAHAVCRFMRQHVAVALSGDGGDEGFGGYDYFWQLARIVNWQRLPVPIRRIPSYPLVLLARRGLIPGYLPRRMDDLVDSENSSVIQGLFGLMHDHDHRQLCVDTDLLPVRRLFEPRWDYQLDSRASRLEQLSAQVTEINTRLVLPDDYLFKVDTASMREGLEVRVPMLDEDLFAFGLTLPHKLKVKGRACKQVLRMIARRRLPAKVANKPKLGFGIPVDTWVGEDFKERLRLFLLGPESRLSEFFRPEVYRPIIETFCGGHLHAGTSRKGIYKWAIMLLSIQVALADRNSRKLPEPNIEFSTSDGPFRSHTVHRAEGDSPT